MSQEKKKLHGGGDDGDEENEFSEFLGELPDADGALAKIDRVLEGTGPEHAEAERNARRKKFAEQEQFGSCCIDY